MLTTLAVSGYRSIADVVVPLDRLTVVTGPNGSGKSNLHRAIRLLASAADGGMGEHLLQEGGFDSALWAGPEKPQGPGAQGTMRTRPIALQLGFASDELGYLVDVGLPRPSGGSLFERDPELKRELIFAGPAARPNALVVERKWSKVRVRDTEWRMLDQRLDTDESVLTELAEGDMGLELLGVRRMLRSWRFYDGFRTDAGAPARQPRIAMRSRSLAHDGRDLATAWRTMQEFGGGKLLAREVDRAFPGMRVEVGPTGSLLELQVHQPGLLRPLSAAELSDGTLRYLLLCAALLPERPAPFLVLNEPEASLHPDLIRPLGGLVRAASERSQIMVVTHSSALADALAEAGAGRIELENEGYGTRVLGQGLLTSPVWEWGSR